MTDIGLQAMKKYQYDDDPVLATCGISINKDLTQVKGGVLETPKVCMEDEKTIFMSLETSGSWMIRLCFANRAWRGRPHMVYAYTNMTKVVSPAGWSDNNHPECNNNVACEEYKRMGPGSRTYNERNLSKELTNKQVKFFISLGYIQEEEELRLKYLQFVQEDAHAAVCFTNLYC
ncbi:hypothetical protein ACFX2B_005283 [Malus domestica]